MILNIITMRLTPLKFQYVRAKGSEGAHHMEKPLQEQTRRPKRGEIQFGKLYKPMVIIFIPCFLYAFMRYTISHNEPVYDLPFYLANKVFGVAGVIMMALAYVIAPAAKVWPKLRQYLGHRKYLGMGGFLLGFGHGMMSLLLMSPNNYKVFYVLETGRLNWQGSLSMFFGTIAILHLGFIMTISIPAVMKEMNPSQWKLLQRGGVIALITTFLHIAAFGYKSWFNLDKWYEGMPPFSMVGASSILVLLGVRYAIIYYGKNRVKVRESGRERGSALGAMS